MQTAIQQMIDKKYTAVLEKTRFYYQAAFHKDISGLDVGEIFWLFLPDIKFRVKCVEILRIQMFFYGIEPFAEMSDLRNAAFTKTTARAGSFRPSVCQAESDCGKTADH